MHVQNLASMKRFQLKKPITQNEHPWYQVTPLMIYAVLTLCIVASINTHIINVSPGSLGSNIHDTVKLSTHFHNLQ
jgi:hypothetical protein